jgi:hypothetical protein
MLECRDTVNPVNQTILKQYLNHRGQVRVSE